MIPDPLEHLGKVRRLLAAVSSDLRQAFLHDWQSIIARLNAAAEELAQLEGSRELGRQREAVLREARELRQDAFALANELERRSRVLGQWQEAMGSRFSGYRPSAERVETGDPGQSQRWEA